MTGLVFYCALSSLYKTKLPNMAAIELPVELGVEVSSQSYEKLNPSKVSTEQNSEDVKTGLKTRVRYKNFAQNFSSV